MDPVRSGGRGVAGGGRVRMVGTEPVGHTDPGDATALLDGARPVPTAALVAASAAGDPAAWNALVERFAGLVMAVARRHRLPEKDAEDVSQTVWLRLVEHLTRVRDPEALAGWLVSTTRNESLRQLRISGRVRPVDPLAPSPFEEGTTEDVDADLLRLERRQALRAGLHQLPGRDRELLLLLVHDPPISYAEIGRRLGMPVGGIGPTRRRCLDRLRATPAVSAYLRAAGDEGDREGGSGGLPGLVG